MVKNTLSVGLLQQGQLELMLQLEAILLLLMLLTWDLSIHFNFFYNPSEIADLLKSPI